MIGLHSQFPYQQMQTEERYPSIFRSDVDASINAADYAVEGSIQAQTQIKSNQVFPRLAGKFRSSVPNRRTEFRARN
jgi:hypothetical protein